MKKKTIAVLFGGCSSEYGISLNSGYAVLANMDREKYQPIAIGITKDGRWLRYDGVLEKIRSREIPVICLTAMGSVSDKVRGLRLGAEDYIVKPFEAMELLARIEVVLRRFHTDESSILQYDEIQVDIQRHTVTKDGEEVTLTPKQFDVLVFLMKHVDLAVSRDQLLSAVWGYEFEGESRTVDIHVQQVRKKMGLQGRLVTISKLGYRLESRNNR